MAEPNKGTLEPLKGISTSAEVERLSSLLSQLSESIAQGQVPVLRLSLLTEPNIKTQRIPEGFTYYDKTLKKVRTWDGTAWRDHF